jgi:hypothetical protein
MPWEARDIVGGPIVTKIVEEQEWIEFLGVAKAECSAKLDAGTFDGRLRVDDASNGTNGHGAA